MFILNFNCGGLKRGRRSGAIVIAIVADCYLHMEDSYIDLFLKVERVEL